MKLRPLLHTLFLFTAPVLFAAPPVLIDFGNVAKTSIVDEGLHWNNVTDQNQRELQNTPLKDTQGWPSGIALTVVSTFTGSNLNGTTKNVPGYPSSATSDSLYGNVESFNNRKNVTPVLKLSGLEPGQKYDITFYASRMSANDDRTTLYTLAGAATTGASLNVADNREDHHDRQGGSTRGRRHPDDHDHRRPDQQ